MTRQRQLVERERTARLATQASHLERHYSERLASLRARLDVSESAAGCTVTSSPLDQPGVPAWAVAVLVQDGRGMILPGPIASPRPAGRALSTTPQSWLTRAQQVEFAEARPLDALSLYRETALASGSPEEAAQALVGAIRCQRQLGRFDGAIGDAERLEKLFGDVVSLTDVPYRLVARQMRARILLLDWQQGSRGSPVRCVHAVLDLLMDLGMDRYHLEHETGLAQRAVVELLWSELDSALAPGDRGWTEAIRARARLWRSPLAARLGRLYDAWTPQLDSLLADTQRGGPYAVVAAHRIAGDRTTLIVVDRQLLASALRDLVDPDVALVPCQSGAPLPWLPGQSLALAGAAGGRDEASMVLAAVGLTLLTLLAVIGVSLMAARARAAVALATGRSLFLARFSHELKTPLTSIRLLSEGLVQGPHEDSATTRRHLGLVAREAARLERLLLNVLAYSRDLVDTAGRHPILEPCDLDELVEDALAVLRPAVGNSSIAFEPSDDPLVVAGDRDALTRVVINLVANALRFTPEGAAVDVSCAPVDDRVRLSVRDRGPGVPSDRTRQIFEPFYRAAAGASTHEEGLGLGLFISRTIVERHGGTIRVATSTEGGGATFVVDLPRSPAPEVARP
ncbi:MAG: HAMP domain-containing histidine kinase [Candidatus Wallbacteria bacterium]|nr:HAMP domain-containing histidine kinase [Candidatus Wallbacteria bacterium]